MSQKLLIKIIVGLIFLTVIGTPFFYFPWGVYPYVLAKQLMFQSLVEVIFFLWVALALSFPKYRPRLTPLTLCGGIFLAVLLLVSVTGVDSWQSLWSTYERGIGTVAFFHLAALALVISSLYQEIPRRKLLYASLGTSLLIDVLALIQLWVPQLLLIENPGTRPGATFGNPTFMTGYLMFNIFIGMYFLLDTLKRTRERGALRGQIPLISFLVTAIIANVSIVFLAQTRGDIIALAVGVITLLGLFYVRPPEFLPSPFNARKLYAISLFAIVCLAAVFALTLKNNFWKNIPGFSRFQSVSFSLDNRSVAPRLFALKAAWQGFLEKPLSGWGPENFDVVFDRHYDPRSLEYSYKETQFDKPHNVILEYLDSGGILLLLAFMVFLGAAMYEVLRIPDVLWRSMFIASIAAYVAGKVFIFETIGPLFMLYLFFGLADGAFRNRQKSPLDAQTRKEAYGSSSLGPLVGVFAVIAGLIVYVVNIQSLTVSYYHYKAFQNFLHQDIEAGISNFKKGLSLWSPYLWNFKRDYAIAVAGQYFNRPGTVSNEDAILAIQSMEEVRDEHPSGAFNHYALVNMYNEVSAIDPQYFISAAESEAKVALQKSPGRQVVYFYLAKTRTLNGDYPGALAILKTALEEDPKVPDAHFYYGLVSFANKEQDIGYREIKTAIAMGRQWVTFYEPRVVAGYFADSGHLQEALGLYETAFAMAPDDLETEIKLGAAYFFVGNNTLAKKYLSDAARKFDFKKSPSYQEFKPILDKLGVGGQEKLDIK